MGLSFSASKDKELSDFLTPYDGDWILINETPTSIIIKAYYFYYIGIHTEYKIQPIYIPFNYKNKIIYVTDTRWF